MRHLHPPSDPSQVLCLIGCRAIGQGLTIEAVLRLQYQATKVPRQDIADPGIEEARLRADAPLTSGASHPGDKVPVEGRHQLPRFVQRFFWDLTLMA